MRFLSAFGCLSLMACASGAQAEWHEVSGDHFVLYANHDKTELAQFAERLERFHAAMAYWFKRPPTKPSPSNRVTVFVVPNQSAVRNLMDDYRRYAAGYYKSRAGATTAVVPRLRRPDSAYYMSAETILYHEYAHHFLAGMTARAFPRWFVEGFAEFFAATRFYPDGSVGLGAPAMYRVEEFDDYRSIPIRRLLEFDGGTRARASEYDASLAQSWALFHHLMFDPGRSGQLVQYQALLGAGASALDAAEGAFGDLDVLETELKSYKWRRKLSQLLIEGNLLQVGSTAVRPLGAGEAAVVPARLQLRHDVSSVEALDLLADVREIALRFPSDPVVLATLAEAEYRAGNDDAAIAVADRALAIDPNAIDAHIQKGNALYRQAARGGTPQVSWQEVRNQFIRANKAENDHPIPLIKYYSTFGAQGVEPTKAAIEGLEWAMVLAPFDSSLRWLVARQMLAESRLNDAAETLAPLAYSPHPGEDTEKARDLLSEIQSRIASEASTQNP